MIKSVASEALLRRICASFKPQFSTAAQLQPDTKLQTFKTSESNPIQQTTDQLSQFYKIPATDKQIFLYGGLPKSYEIQAKTFNETCLMIRKPSLDVINCLKAVDLSKPVVKFVLFGKKGSGKSLSLAHILHYGHKAGFLLVHVPWVSNWMRRCKESSNSETREGFIDLNLDAAAWLMHFKSQNEHLLSNPEFKTSREYVWSKRESTPKDSPLTVLVDQGINRIKYASDCVVYLAEEIKRLSKENHCKTLVVIDGFNAFFFPSTRVFTEKKEVVHPHKVTLSQAFLNLTQSDWNNSAVVVTVDELFIGEPSLNSYLPRYLLGKDGFDHLDPFVPIFVENYSPKELTSCLSYYRDRKWIQEVQNQDDELAFISASNPYKLMQLCASL